MLQCDQQHSLCTISSSIQWSCWTVHQQAMKAGCNQGLSAHHHLHNSLLSYRVTPHATTKLSPSTVLLGRSLWTLLDLLKPDLEQTVCQKQTNQKSDKTKFLDPRNSWLHSMWLWRTCPRWVNGFRRYTADCTQKHGKNLSSQIERCGTKLQSYHEFAIAMTIYPP